MAKTLSTMMPLGSDAPNFSLPDPDGNIVSLADFEGANALVVMFICNHCPFVVHVAPELARLAKDYQDRGAAFVAISSNDIETHPDDSPAKMKEESAKWGYTFPYLYDESQKVAQSYQAACTPDFFMFNAANKLVYRGRLDESSPGNDKPLTGADLRAALDAVLAGEPVSEEQRPSMGCNIKWKTGNEPAHA